MKLISKSKIVGWLPAGLILNTRLATGSISAPTIIPQLARKKAGSLPLVVVPIAQADDNSCIMLSGRFLSPVLMGDLSNGYGNQTSVAVSGYRDGHRTLNPFSDPIILLANAYFSGEALRYVGDDTPSITIDPSLAAGHEDDFLTLYKGSTPSTRTNIYELTYPASLYIPEWLGSVAPYGFPTELVSHVVPSVRGLQAVEIGNSSDFSDYYYGEGAIFIAPVFEFTWNLNSAWGLEAYYHDKSSGAVRQYRVSVTTKGPVVAEYSGDTMEFVIGPDNARSQLVIAHDTDGRALTEQGLTHATLEDWGIGFLLNNAGLNRGNACFVTLPIPNSIDISALSLN